jgi:ABC-type transporter Mla subunit MlaD
MTQQTRAAESRTAAQVLRARSEAASHAASHAASLAAGAEANAVETANTVASTIVQQVEASQRDVSDLRGHTAKLAADRERLHATLKSLRDRTDALDARLNDLPNTAGMWEALSEAERFAREAKQLAQSSVRGQEALSDRVKSESDSLKKLVTTYLERLSAQDARVNTALGDATRRGDSLASHPCRPRLTRARQNDRGFARRVADDRRVASGYTITHASHRSPNA